MNLSNAERQRRFRERRNKLATSGVTSEMVDRVAELTWERARQDDPSLPVWSEMLSACRTKRGRENWRSHMDDIGLFVPSEAEASELYGVDGDLVRRVTLVLQAALVPPSERKPDTDAD